MVQGPLIVGVHRNLLVPQPRLLIWLGKGRSMLGFWIPSPVMLESTAESCLLLCVKANRSSVFSGVSAFQSRVYRWSQLGTGLKSLLCRETEKLENVYTPWKQKLGY